MSNHKRLAVVLLTVAGLSAATAPAFATTPDPAGPGCQGRIVAVFNHNSGLFGPSGNPNASAGPGYFLGPQTGQTVREVQTSNCT